MKNEVFVDVEEACAAPPWLCNVGPFVQKALARLGLDHWEVSVLFCGDAFIRDLNRRYRQIDSPTDVLSFGEGGEYGGEGGETWFAAGDIVVSLETLESNCVEFAVGEDEELKRLLVHGLLHLKGMDHGDNSPEQPMLKLQEELLQDLRGEAIIRAADNFTTREEK